MLNTFDFILKDDSSLSYDAHLYCPYFIINYFLLKLSTTKQSNGRKKFLIIIYPFGNQKIRSGSGSALSKLPIFI